VLAAGSTGRGFIPRTSGTYAPPVKPSPRLA
jgi:hypothetical protein